MHQSSNNSSYLNHNGYKEYDQYGEVFADYRIDFDTSKKILIFGHNSSKIKTPFSNLENYYDKSYYNNHKYITLTLENEVRTYAIFSVYVETSDWSYMNLKFDSSTDWYNHILKLKNKSLYDTGVDVENDDEVLILQTCSYNQNYNDYAALLQLSFLPIALSLVFAKIHRPVKQRRTLVLRYDKYISATYFFRRHLLP